MPEQRRVEGSSYLTLENLPRILQLQSSLGLFPALPLLHSLHQIWHAEIAVPTKVKPSAFLSINLRLRGAAMGNCESPPHLRNTQHHEPEALCKNEVCGMLTWRLRKRMWRCQANLRNSCLKAVTQVSSRRASWWCSCAWWLLKKRMGLVPCFLVRRLRNILFLGLLRLAEHPLKVLVWFTFSYRQGWLA